MPSNPSSKWFWNDWENDPGLRLCSLAAQGLWMRMLSIAARHVPAGYVAVSGTPLDATGLARLTGHPEPEVRGLMDELEARGVFSRNRRGFIYNRRMVRDQKQASLSAEHGKKGGNPKIRRGAVPKEERARRFSKSDSPKKAQRIFDRDGGKCHWCGVDLSDPNPWHIDHVKAISDGGNNDETNLVASCPKCNRERALIDRPYGRNDSDPNGGVPPLSPKSLKESSSKRDSDSLPREARPPPGANSADVRQIAANGAKVLAINRPLTNAQKHERWVHNVWLHLCRTRSEDEVARITESYANGEPWGKAQFEAIDAEIKAMKTVR